MPGFFDTHCHGNNDLSFDDANKEELDAIMPGGFTEDEIKELTFYRAKGCPVCNGEGYKGRLGVFEILPVTKEIKKFDRSLEPDDLDEALANIDITDMNDIMFKVMKNASNGRI